MTLVPLLSPLATTLWATAFGGTLVATCSTLRRLAARPPRMDLPFGLYPVSILKPVKGVDSDLRNNLESFFYLDYPYFELLFCVPSYRDPACKIIEELIGKYPWVN